MLISREMLLSLFVGFVMVGGAVFVSAGDDEVPGEIVAVENIEREYIAPLDENNNGISDWAEELLEDREVLQAEINPDEPYTLPDTLTEQFSINFFRDYLRSKGVASFPETKEQLLAEAQAKLDLEARDRIYTIDDIQFAEGDTIEDLRAYGNRIAAITVDYSDEIELNEIDILNRALQQNNPDRLTQIIPIREAYGNYLQETLATPVPPSLVRQHIDLINVYNALHEDVLSMENIFIDPLLGLLRLERYQNDAAALLYVYYNIDLNLRQSGVTFREDEPGYLFSTTGALRNLMMQL